MKVLSWRAMAFVLVCLTVLSGCTTTQESNESLGIVPVPEAPIMVFEDPVDEVPAQAVVETKSVVPVAVPKVVIPKPAVPLPPETVESTETLQVSEPVPAPVVEKQETTPQPALTPQQKTEPAPTFQFSCAVEKSCPKMVSCDEAYYHLNVCGFKKRDGDNDGVPCEDICPGG